MFLARQARCVHIVIRGADLGKSMSRYLVERLARLENVTVHPFTEIHALDRTDRLAGVTMRRLSGEQTHIAAHALFIFIGAMPDMQSLTDCVELDRAGFVVTGPALSTASLDTDAWRRLKRATHFLETSIPGVFSVGDVRSGSVKRVAPAVGEGAMAVSFVHAHLGPLR